jgi:hypothetical protein
MEETGILENLALLSVVLPHFEPGQICGHLTVLTLGEFGWVKDHETESYRTDLVRTTRKPLIGCLFSW